MASSVTEGEGYTIEELQAVWALMARAGDLVVVPALNDETGEWGFR